MSGTVVAVDSVERAPRSGVPQTNFERESPLWLACIGGLTHGLAMISSEAADRFWSRVDKSGKCWLWTGSKNDAGYGKLGIKRQGWYAHRLAYELVVGPIPAGFVIDHLCRNPTCVNPVHLEAVTNRENTKRGMAAYGLRAACKRGHDITNPANVYVQPNGRKRCRVCAKDYERANAEKRNARKREVRANAREPQDDACKAAHRARNRAQYARTIVRQAS